MDMAIEHESTEQRLTHIATSIPMHFIPKGTAGALPIIEVGVEAMKQRLRQQSEEIAALQIRSADLAALENVLTPIRAIYDCTTIEAAKRMASQTGASPIDTWPLADLLKAVQDHIEADTALEIEADGMWVLFDGESYQATPDDALELLDAVGLLARTVVR